MLFTNFFSELGLTVTRAGQPNTVSAILFFTAMVMGGAGLVLFFIAFPQFFTKSKSGRLLSRIGPVFGVISAVCFIGVGFTPANLYIEAYLAFVMWAFQILPLAVILYAAAILREPGYPNRYGFVFVAFAVLLALYVVLIATGPDQVAAAPELLTVANNLGFLRQCIAKFKLNPRLSFFLRMKFSLKTVLRT